MVEFKKYCLNDLFDIHYGHFVPKRKQGTKYPFITTRSGNNGIAYRVDVGPMSQGDALTVASDGSVGETYYQAEPFSASNIVVIMEPHDDVRAVWSPSSALYLAACIKQYAQTQFDWSWKYSVNRVRATVLDLPAETDKFPDFAYMASRIDELEAQRIDELSAYLKVSGLDNTELTDEEKDALTKKVDWKKFRIDDVFDINNTSSILKSQITANSGNTPYVTASGQNNGVQTYINSGNLPLEKGPCLMIGGKTFIVTYQSADFVSNDSHNLVLRLKDQRYATEKVYLYLISVIKAYGQERFTWNDAVTKKRLRKGQIVLPVTFTGSIDFDYMQNYITAIEKQSIKGVLAYKDKVIATTKKVVNGNV